MIPVNRPDVLDGSLDILREFAAGRSVRGRFVSLYLGLRRMRAGDHSTLAELGSSAFTAASEIEQYLDRLYTKNHRPEPFVVLTAPFGGSTSQEAPYGARSGTTVPGRTYPTNTWRNNFGIQKGVGCPAESEVIARLLDDPQRRLACPHMALDPEGRHLCRVRDTAYRGEEHAIWLRLSDSGYQVVDLDHPAVVRDYLRPNDHPLPIFPLIGMLYCMAASGVFPDRVRVGIPEFAIDFGFTHDQVDSLFDCDPDSPFNSSIAMRVEDSRVAVVRSLTIPTSDDTLAHQLPDEPHDAVLNTGVGAEIAIARDLQSCGWEREISSQSARTRLRPLRQLETGKRFVLKSNPPSPLRTLRYKSPNGQPRRPTKTSTCLPSLISMALPNEEFGTFRDPAANAVPVERTTLTYRFVRADIEPVKTDVEFL